MKIYNTTMAYYCPGTLHVRIKNTGSVRLWSTDNISKRQTVLNLSKQQHYRGC